MIFHSKFHQHTGGLPNFEEFGFSFLGFSPKVSLFAIALHSPSHDRTSMEKLPLTNEWPRSSLAELLSTTGDDQPIWDLRDRSVFAGRKPRNCGVCPRLRPQRGWQRREQQRCGETAVCACVPRCPQHRVAATRAGGSALPSASGCRTQFGQDWLGRSIETKIGFCPQS